MHGSDNIGYRWASTFSVDTTEAESEFDAEARPRFPFGFVALRAQGRRATEAGGRVDGPSLRSAGQRRRNDPNGKTRHGDS